MKFLDELDALKLPEGSYAIFGSGPLAVRGIRESNDLDIIVNKKEWDRLSKMHPDKLHSNPSCIKLGNLEIYKDWVCLPNPTSELIETAEIINDYPYVTLKYLIAWKEMFKRPKDLEDLKALRD